MGKSLPTTHHTKDKCLENTKKLLMRKQKTKLRNRVMELYIQLSEERQISKKYFLSVHPS